MLIHVGQERTVSVDLRLAIWLALVAGAVNAAGFQSLGFFSANMTGNVSTMSDMLALGHMTQVIGLAALLVTFVLGAFLSTLLIESGQRRQIRGIYAYSIIMEAVLMIPLTLCDLMLPRDLADPLMLLGLSLVMGVQNAATTKISDARVRTTHVSGIATDLGIELAVLLGRRVPDDLTRAKLKLHGATLASFFIGGVLGVLGYQWAGAPVFLAPAALLLMLAIPEARRAQAA